MDQGIYATHLALPVRGGALHVLGLRTFVPAAGRVTSDGTLSRWLRDLKNVRKKPESAGDVDDRVNMLKLITERQIS